MILDDSSELINISFSSDSYDFIKNPHILEKKENFHFNHFFCSKCKMPPRLISIENDKLILRCICENSNQKIYFKDMHKKLLFLDEKDKSIDDLILKCQFEMNEIYNFFCEKLGKNLCRECANKCNEKKHNLKDFNQDIDTKKKK